MNQRKYLLTILLVVTGLGFLVKLFMIQVLDNTYSQAAESNLTRRVRDPAYRGIISDRFDRLLVYNVPVYDIFVVPKDVRELDTARFCKIFQINAKDLHDRLRATRHYSLNKPSHLLGPLYEEEFARVQGYLRDFPGFQVRVRMIRGYRYPYLAHALGYVAEASREALAADTTKHYHMGDHIGISGIEAHYEAYLRGDPGVRYWMADARGRELGSFAGGRYDTLPVRGDKLKLGIDIDLQTYAEDLMMSFSGSIVALEPATGEVLAWVSAPSYAPDLLSGRRFKARFSSLSKQSTRPLFNRPLQAMYRPGSIFKLPQALVALQAGTLFPPTTFPCKQNIIGCHSHPTTKGLVDAITNSCNPYFYKVMQGFIEREGSELSSYKQARKNLKKWDISMSQLGFGKDLQIDVPFGRTGNVPSVQDYDKIYGALRWKYSNIYSLAIGEGENLVVPLQMANFASIIANGGYYYLPHFVSTIGKTKGPLPIYKRRHKVPIRTEYFTIVQNAMQQVVEKGTGRRAKLPGITVCGKTGSVQNYERSDHSVFIAFAPKESPKIALSVYVEFGGEGGSISAAIAGLMIEKYLRGEQAGLRMEHYVHAVQAKNIAKNVH